MNNIDVVVVTYNRVDKLKHTLECYDRQEVLFRNIIVVDNHSTDRTSEFLNEWKNISSEYGKYVLSLEDNLGGAGGFYEGQKFAVSMNADWVLLADDDAYPAVDLIKKLQIYIEDNKNELTDVVALCTSIYYPNGEIWRLYIHQKIRLGLQFLMKPVKESCYQEKCFDVDFLTYVGAIIRGDALRKVGYDIPQYFIYFDDSEHSLRLRKLGRIVCVPALKFVHDGGWNGPTDDIVTWREYYFIRNRIHMLKMYYFIPAIFYSFSCICHSIIKLNYNWECRKMIYTAIKDGWKNKLGKHPIYKPGWHIPKKS